MALMFCRTLDEGMFGENDYIFYGANNEQMKMTLNLGLTSLAAGHIMSS
jgi:hypothetical protein